MLAALILAAATQAAVPADPWRDPARPVDERVADLLKRMTRDEKVSQLVDDSPAIPRLGVPRYRWWNEALHGVARNGRATVFPQAIGLAATFDAGLVQRVTTAIADEARVLYAADQALGRNRLGLTFYAPNVNIFRDPRWGRGHETFGEDPYLTARIGVAYVRGLQGDDPSRLKTAACAKHYAVHSGPEGIRHSFDVRVSKRDLYETYLPAFEALVREAKVESVMCAYNRVDGEPCCASRLLLEDVLRKRWGFDGHVVTDCSAITDFHEGHHVTATPLESAVLAARRGVDYSCGREYQALGEAVRGGALPESVIDEHLGRLLRTRFRLGLFDPAGSHAYDRLPPEVVESASHRALAREAAARSIVLLKNERNVLPLSRTAEVRVLGPNAASADALLGNYFGLSPHLTTVLEGITAAAPPGVHVDYRPSFQLNVENANPLDWASSWAHRAEVAVVVAGLTAQLEGEEGAAIASPEKGDRSDLGLPEAQLGYLKRLRAAGNKPIVLVLTGGSPIDLGEVEPLADAILYAWYPGQEGGHAVADVLYGDVNPSGRLPVTFPGGAEVLPRYDDYSMAGRTYRYATKPPQFPFGFGLSYTRFTYGAATLSASRIRAGQGATVEVPVTNSGARAGDEIVQVYVSALDGGPQAPLSSLRAFRRIRLEPGETRPVRFDLSADDLSLVDDDGERRPVEGRIRISVAGAAPLARSVERGAPAPAVAEIVVR